MSKRVAEEYITKENGTVANPNFTQSQPTMSTAAQLAKRKIAQPKGRLPANRTSHSTFGPPSSNQPAQQQTFGSVNGGITFGASQSFPPGITPQGGSFDFQLPQSSSFTFGAPPTAASNPFANLNGNTPSTDSQDDISMQSPQKKPSLGNVFGSSNTMNNNMSSGFSFGQQKQAPTQTNGGFTFGSTQSTSSTANGGGLFGMTSTSEEPKQNTNPFGQSSQPQSAFGGFGQPVPPADTNPASFTFGQGASVPKSQEPTFSFGQNNNNTTAPAPSFGFTPAQPNHTEQTHPPSFSFGQSAPQSQPPTFSFGQSASAPEIQAGSASFGSSQPTATFTFGQPQSAPPAANPFTGFTPNQPQQTPATPLLFANAALSTETPTGNNEHSVSPEKPALLSSESNTEPVKNPFAGLFGQNNASQAAPDPTPTFSFGATAQPVQDSPSHDGSGGFKKPADMLDMSHSSAESSGLSSILSSQVYDHDATPLAKPSSTVQQSLSSGGLFTPVSSATQNTGTTGGLFGNMSNASTSAKPAFGFGKPSQTTALEPPSAPSTNLSSTTPSAPSAATPAKQGLFPGSSSDQSEPLTNGDDVQKTEESKRLVYTKAAPIIPGHLEAAQYREYDRNYRLHSLNLGLQHKIASLDPRSQDFDSIIRQYVASRESIGESLGLYVRNVAGMKRKGMQSEDFVDESYQAKRARSEAAPEPAAGVSSGFQPRPSEAGSSSSTSANIGDSPSKATTTLKGMIPQTSASDATSDSSSSAKPTNVFPGFGPASTPKASTTPSYSNPFAGQGSAAPSASNLFSKFGQAKPVETASEPTAALPSVESTTPIKSPPKKPVFEVPKFGGGAGGTTNFMAAFGDKAKASAARLEKTLKEKRKAEDFDSDEDDEEAFNKQMEEETRAKRAKIDAIMKGGFTPSFGTKSTTEATKSTFTFGSAPSVSKQSSIANATSGGFKPSVPNANPFATLASSNGSDDQSESANDEDNDEGDQVDDTQDADYEEAESSAESDEQEDDLPEDEAPDQNGHDDDEAEDDDSDDGDFEKAMQRSRRRQNPNAGKSLFDRIEPAPGHVKDSPVNGVEKATEDEPKSPILEPAKNSSFQPALWGSHIGHSTPEKPAFSPFTPTTSQSTSPYKPATTFNFTAAPATSLTPTPGASIFAGGTTRGGPVPGEGMFGSRPSTPSNADKIAPPTSLAKSVLASPAGTDNTWKQGNGISFGPTSNAAPTFKFTASSPFKGNETSSTKPFGSLFGTSSGPTSSDTGKLGFNFGTPASTLSPAPGFLGAVSHLGGGSAASSAVSSRATSPGLTDTESVATNESEDATDDPQTSLMDSRVGEENETCLWEGRSKALLFVNKEAAEGTKLKANDWNSMGVGQVRVLQNKETKKTRVVFRVEPSASILINSNLVEGTEYESVPSNKSGAVRGTLFYKDNLTRWVFKVKTPEMADAFAKAMEDHKKA